MDRRRMLELIMISVALAGSAVAPGAPLPYGEKRLVWNDARGARERTTACDKPSFN